MGISLAAPGDSNHKLSTDSSSKNLNLRPRLSLQGAQASTRLVSSLLPPRACSIKWSRVPRSLSQRCLNSGTLAISWACSCPNWSASLS